jgi:hypothetical protein
MNDDDQDFIQCLLQLSKRFKSDEKIGHIISTKYKHFDVLNNCVYKNKRQGYPNICVVCRF